jgi:hypothetical protein
MKLLSLFAFFAATQTVWSDPLDFWTLGNMPPNVSLQSIASGGGRFVGVGDGIVSSSDGLNWVRHESPVATADSIRHLRAIAYGNGRFVAVRDLATILSSSDGVNWELHPSSLPNCTFPSCYPFLDGIAFGNGLFVAVGGQRILTSADGVHWTQVIETTNLLHNVAYGNGRFVAAASRGKVSFLMSTNGVNWVERSLGIDGWILSVAYGVGQFVGVGSSDTAWWGPDAPRSIIVTSSDGLNWTEQQGTILVGAQGEGAMTLGPITYGNGLFAALVGRGRILTSSDGMRWVLRVLFKERRVPWSDLGVDASAIASGNGYFVTVGRQGTGLRSRKVLSLSMSTYSVAAERFLSVEARVPLGFEPTIQTSTDLVSWRTLANSLDIPMRENRAFYRLVTDTNRP